jgi:hypothetical protein
MCARLGPARLSRQSSKVSGDRRSLPAFSRAGSGSRLTMEAADPDICVPHGDEHHVLTIALRSGVGTFALPRRSGRKNRAVFSPPAPSAWRGRELGSATDLCTAGTANAFVGTLSSASIQLGSSLAPRNAGRDPWRQGRGNRSLSNAPLSARQAVSGAGSQAVVNVRHPRIFWRLVLVAGQQDCARSLRLCGKYWLRKQGLRVCTDPAQSVLPLSS